MTYQDRLLEQFEKVNPVPDASRLLEEDVVGTRLTLLLEQREESTMTTTELRPVEEATVRTRRWNKPVMALAAVIVLIVGVISAISMTSGSDSPDVAAPIDVTWTQTCTAPVSRPGQGLFQTCETVTTSDPRLSGIEEVNYFEIQDGGPWINEGTATLTNNQGSWEGSLRTRAVHGPTQEEWATVGNWVGRGAYEGLHLASVSRGTGDPNGSGHTSVITGTISAADTRAVNVTLAGECTAPVSRPGEGLLQTCETLTSSDPRMLGTAEVRFVYLEGEEPWLLEGTAVTTNEGGSWEGTFRLRQAGELGSEEYETFHEGVGRGAYEGLQYTGIARDTGDPNGGGHTSVSNFTISPITP